ncbi:hypothetical protein MBT84_43585 [Streptomyces sp. MBT84]|nr:hypothetical protein [Streptomyces sp. MBT84]
MGRSALPRSAEDELNVLVYTEPQDGDQLADVFEWPSENEVAVVRLTLVENRFQSGQHGFALSGREVGAIVVLTTPFTGLSPRALSKPVTQLRRDGADTPARGRPWRLPLADRVLLVAVYWRTDPTLRQLAPLFGVLKSAVSRVTDHLGQKLTLEPRKRFAKDAVLIV